MPAAAASLGWRKGIRMSSRRPHPEPRPFPLFSPFPLIGVSAWFTPPMPAVEPRRQRRSSQR
jgi:hypothetical protein